MNKAIEISDRIDRIRRALPGPRRHVFNQNLAKVRSTESTLDAFLAALESMLKIGVSAPTEKSLGCLKTETENQKRRQVDEWLRDYEVVHGLIRFPLKSYPREAML